MTLTLTEVRGAVGSALSTQRFAWLAGTLLFLGISKLAKLDLLGKQAVSPEQ